MQPRQDRFGSCSRGWERTGHGTGQIHFSAGHKRCGNRDLLGTWRLSSGGLTSPQMMGDTMSDWKIRLSRSGTAALAALWLIAAPQTAAAQWWEDEEAYEEEVTLGEDEDVGGVGDDGAGVDGQGVFGETEETAPGEDAREFWRTEPYDGYYATVFEDEEEWGGWF